MSKQNILRQFWGFFIVSLKAQLRNPSAVFFGFFFPIIFIIIFGFLSDSGTAKLKVGFIPNSGATQSSFRKTLDSTSLFDVSEGNYDDLTTQLQKGKIDGFVEFKDADVLSFTTSSSRAQQGAVLKQTLDTVIDKQTLGQKQIEPVFKIENHDIVTREARYIDFALPGLIGFSLLSAAVSGTSFSFIALKRTQALKRLFAAPTHASTFLLGQASSRVVFSLAQNLVLILVAMIFFHFSPRYGIVSLSQMLVVILLGLVVFLGFGYIVAGIVKTDDQAAPLSQIFILPQVLLSGTFFAVDSLPNWLQTISKALPLYSFNEALRSISLDGQNLWSPDVSLDLAALLLWAVAVYFIASKVFRVR